MDNQGVSLGSIGAEVTLDLSKLEKQVAKAKSLLAGLEKQQASVSSGGASGRSGGGKSSGGGGGLGSSVSQFASLDGIAGKIVGSVGRVAGVIGLVAGALYTVKQAGDVAFAAISNGVANAAGFQQLDTSIRAIASNTGTSGAALDAFNKRLRDLNLYGGEAKQSILNLLSAQLPLNDNTFKLVGAAQNLAVAYGTTTTSALNTITSAIGSLNPTLLEQFGITENLPEIYDKYAASLGVSSAALSEAQKRQALMNQVLERGNQFNGIAADSVGNVGRAWTILQANVQTISGTLGSALLPAISAILTPLVNMSREFAGFLVDNQPKITQLGQILAAKLQPAIDNLITGIRNIPWNTLISQGYVAAQVLQIIGRYALFAVQYIVAMGQVAVGAGQVMVGAFMGPLGALGALSTAIGEVYEVIRSGGKAKVDFAGIYKQANDAFVAGQNTVAAGFKNIANGINSANKSSEAATKGITADFNQIAKGFDAKAFWDSLPGTASKAIADANSVAAAGAQKLSAETLKKLQDLQREMGQENEQFAYDQANKARDFAEQLATLVAQHRDAYAKIQNDIDEETRTFNKAQEERSAKYASEMSKLEDQDRQRRNDIQMQIAEELSKGRNADQTKLASLRSRLSYEDAQNKAAVAELNKTYQEDTDNATEAHEDKLGDLQTQLDKEMAIQKAHGSEFAQYRDYQIADDISKLQQSHERQQAEDSRAHALRMADFARRGAEIIGQNQATGTAAGTAFGNGMSSALAATAPTVNATASALGTNAGASTANAVGAQKDNTGNQFKNMLAYAAAVGASIIGPAFGPLGQLIGNNIGAVIATMGGPVGNALKNMLNSAVVQMGNITDFGRQLIAKAGESIKTALGAVGGAFQSAWNAAGFPKFATGGIVGGSPGTDTNVIQATRGEMILNAQQQRNLFSMINQGSSGGDANTGIVVQNLTVQLPGVTNGQQFTRELKLELGAMR